MGTLRRQGAEGSPATWDGCVGWKAKHMTALGTSTTADGCRGFRPRLSRFQAHTKDFSVLQSPSSNLHRDMSGMALPRGQGLVPALLLAPPCHTDQPGSPSHPDQTGYRSGTGSSMAAQGHNLLWKRVPTMAGSENRGASGNGSQRKKGRPRPHCLVLAGGHQTALSPSLPCSFQPTWCPGSLENKKPTRVAKLQTNFHHTQGERGLHQSLRAPHRLSATPAATHRP